MQLHAKRLTAEPIIAPGMELRMGSNINGPSLLRTPSWLPGRLANYYLYFAHHTGRYIRLAYADNLTGPWHIYEPGVLDVEDSFFPSNKTLISPGYHAHIASPDVHLHHPSRTVRMLFHGQFADGSQGTRIAYAADGLSFAADAPVLGPAYLRVFTYREHLYSVVWGGQIWRSSSWGSVFEPGPSLVDIERGSGPDRIYRHGAAYVTGDTLNLFYSRIGDKPECILYTTVELSRDWTTWRPAQAYPLLKPEQTWEGGCLSLTHSREGAADIPLRELRDPCIFFDEDARTYLLYAGAGENGIGIAELKKLSSD